jgi:hypothetical protein
MSAALAVTCTDRTSTDWRMAAGKSNNPAQVLSLLVLDVGEHVGGDYSERLRGGAIADLL